MRLADLRAIYLARLPQLLAMLRSDRSDLSRPDAAAVTRLRAMAHRIRGSAGTFGLAEVSLLAAAVERADAEAIGPAVDELVAASERALEGALGHFRIALLENDPALPERVPDLLLHPIRRFERSPSLRDLQRSLAEGEVALAIVGRCAASPQLENEIPPLREAAASRGATVLVLECDDLAVAEPASPGLRRLAWPADGSRLEDLVIEALQCFALRRADAAR
jgi:HPt (histidine-containing phosphotransfer) domain-containing protein